MAGAIDYRHVFEAAHEALLLLDTASKVVTASDGFLRGIGRARAEIVGSSIFDLPPYAGAPGSTQNLRAALDTMLSAGLTLGTAKLQGGTSGAPDEPRLWTHARLSSVPGAGGKLEHVVLAFDTPAGGQERSESDSERRLRKLVEHTYDAVALFEPHGRVAYVSPTIRRVMGYTEQEFAALDPRENVHPDDRARFGEELDRLFAEPGGLLLTRFRALHRDGRFRVLENTAVNRLQDPDVAAVISTFRDVTAQVELENELRRGAERLRIALDAAHAMSWEWDVKEDRFTYSKEYAAFFGIVTDAPEAVAREPLSTVHPEDRDVVRTAWQRCITTGAPFDAEFRGLPAGDQTRHYASHGQLSHDVGGVPVRCVGVTWDVTERWRLLAERRSLEQRMQESQKLESLGVLAGGIAHDFSNLLMVILGNISLVQRELGEAHPTLAHLEQMEEATRRATDLCRQLLAYAGKGRFVLQQVSINRLIDETTHLLHVSISKKASLQFHLDSGAPAVIADATQIRQVLMNLVMNASDAIGDRNGTISIRTGAVRADRTYLDATFLAPDIPVGEYVFVEVSDTGSGMSPETQARIFDPFFTTKFTGRGLGLAAVLGIVRGHKGALKVYSELGRGSCFKLLLPAAPGASEHPPPRVPRLEQPAAGGTILVVDDETAVRNVASLLLQDLGFRTLLAADGNAAIKVYREHADEIVGVLLDLTMPGLDGEETFRELRKIRSDVRVLLMSGYNQQDAVGRFVGRGVAGFIQKPFTFDDLERRMRSLLS